MRRRSPLPGVAIALLALSPAVPSQDPGPANEAEAAQWQAPPPVLGPTARDGDAAPAGVPGRLDDVGSILRRSSGVHWLDGALVGGGPDYEVGFDRAGVTYTPALGRRAPQRYDVRFELRSYGRADGRPRHAAGTEPAIVDGVVDYRRPGVVERYAVRTDGVKQSFLFDALPPGGGDLVVRLAVQTDLPLAHARPDSVRYELGGIGGVEIGAVVGIDADGRRADGSMTLAGDLLELRLPAAFVDRAALPLELDPLVGAVFAPATGFDEEDPDVAYDLTNDVYLVVWEREFAGPSTGIRCQLVSGAGALVGGLTLVRSSAFNGTDPRVANVNLRDSFAVVWNEGGDILGASVTAGGSVSSAVTVAGSADFEFGCDVGGETTTFDDDALVVWWNLTTSEIEAAQFTIPAAGAPFVFGQTTISTGFTDSWPAIAKGGGPTGTFLIVWNREFSETAVRGAVVDRNLVFLDSFVAITSSGGNDEDLPDVDGNGRNWVVAFETEVTPGSGDNDVGCVGVTYQPSLGFGYLSGPQVIIEGGFNDDERNVSVAYMGHSVLVGYTDEVASPNYDAYVKSVDPFTCADCEGEFALAITARDADFVAMAAESSAGGSNDRALIVWEETDTATGDGDLSAVRFRSDDGIFVDLGFGCGTGGAATSTCAVIGNSGFSMRIQHANTNVPAWAVLSATRADIPCGSCTIVPDPFTGFVFGGGNTDFNGDASAGLPIPFNSSLVGRVFYFQWFVGGGSSCFGFDLSNAGSVQIQS